jgi:uncharacterized protein (DUF427 family)
MLMGAAIGRAPDAGRPARQAATSRTQEVSMGKSPGHQKWPTHKVEETPVAQRVTVEVAGEVVAESGDVIKVDEDRHPVRYYFPRIDVRMERLERSSTTTECPFKGTAHYFHLIAADRTFDDAVWTYEDPYDEHRGLKDRLAFYEERIDGLRITPQP